MKALILHNPRLIDTPLTSRRTEWEADEHILLSHDHDTSCGHCITKNLLACNCHFHTLLWNFLLLLICDAHLGIHSGQIKDLYRAKYAALALVMPG